jgi:DNA-binding PadR family transcriptional regulator
MFDPGAMRYVVLQLIADKPRHGYEIIKEIEQRAGGGYAPSPGVIYPMLSMLLDLGHVSATLDGNKKLHEVTPEGLAFLEENREFVDVVMARLDRLGSPAEGHHDLRQLMHALKEVVITRGRVEMPDETRLGKIAAILRQAAVDIGALE